MKGETERGEIIKMDKKNIYEIIYKNRFLILTCSMLILGTIFGTSMLKVMPDEFSRNLFEIVSKTSTDFMNIFINKFIFSFFILSGLFFSGTGIFGSFTVPFLILINGLLFGMENALNYNFSGMDYIFNSLINFSTSALFINFLLIIMSENSIFSSKQISKAVFENSNEKTHYNAKKITVKFITFTVIFTIISLISACFYKFIQPIL